MKRSVFVIQGRYGDLYGWEDLCEYGWQDYPNPVERRKAAQADLKEYRLAEPTTPHRIKTRYEDDGMLRVWAVYHFGEGLTESTEAIFFRKSEAVEEAMRLKDEWLELGCDVAPGDYGEIVVHGNIRKDGFYTVNRKQTYGWNEIATISIEREYRGTEED